jgi:hypothetical protein
MQTRNRCALWADKTWSCLSGVGQAVRWRLLGFDGVGRQCQGLAVSAVTFIADQNLGTESSYVESDAANGSGGNGNKTSLACLE